MAWRTAELAALDMQWIAEAGIVNFGARHAHDYTNKLLDAFDLLSAHPDVARERHAALSIVRVMPCGSHNILFVVEDGDVLILRVLHGLQNWVDLL